MPLYMNQNKQHSQIDVLEGKSLSCDKQRELHQSDEKFCCDIPYQNAYLSHSSSVLCNQNSVLVKMCVHVCDNKVIYIVHTILTINDFNSKN